VASFQDTQGRAWEVTVNYGAMRRVRDSLSVNLMELVGGPLLERVTADPVLLIDILYWVLKPQADERKITPDDFAEIFDGDSVYAASMALRESVINFFPKDKREAALRMVERVDRMAEEMWQKMEQEIDAQFSTDAGTPSITPPESSE
jgi:hypothetical protein